MYLSFPFALSLSSGTIYTCTCEVKHFRVRKNSYACKFFLSHGGLAGFLFFVLGRLVCGEDSVVDSLELSHSLFGPFARRGRNDAAFL
jgi:hypothetical protein